MPFEPPRAGIIATILGFSLVVSIDILFLTMTVRFFQNIFALWI